MYTKFYRFSYISQTPSNLAKILSMDQASPINCFVVLKGACAGTIYTTNIQHKILAR